MKKIRVIQKEYPIEMMSTMGCRTQNGADINGPESFAENINSVILNGKTCNNVWSAALKDGRGNICPVTIILPTLAMEALENLYYEKNKNNTEANVINAITLGDEEFINNFLDLLNRKIDEAKDMLIERFEWICSQSPSSAKFMYENNVMYGYKPEEGIRSALKHGTLAIGQLGLAETLQILVGCDHTEPEGMEVAKRIEQMFKDKCAAFKEEYKLNFGVYYTPAENLCYKAMKRFQAKYGKIPDVSDKDFFTNSMHCPVWKRVSPFDKIDIESQLTGYSSAGCITYVEFDDESRKNLAAVQAVVDYAMDNDIPYFAINVPCDTCMECGDCGEIEEECPKCGSHNIQHLRRVTGYLTGDYKTAFNPGKIQECEMRVKHI